MFALLEVVLWWLCQGLLVLLAAVQSARRRWTQWRVRRRLRLALERLGLRRRGRAGPQRGGHNRTAASSEWALLRLHVDCPHLGLRGLASTLARTAGIVLSASTVHAILRRRRADLVELEEVRRGRPRRIVVPERMLRWSIDLTLVWLLGVLPVWVLGVVDCHSSRLVALRPVRPTGAAIAGVLSRLFLDEGTPAVVVTDNGGQFLSSEFCDALARAGVKHRRIRPGHPWTNGRVERVFRTFKELQRFYAPVLVSRGHLEAVCRDVMRFYNHCRPHMSFGGRTPTEVDKGLEPQAVIARETLFDGQLHAFRFT